MCVHIYVYIYIYKYLSLSLSLSLYIIYIYIYIYIYIHIGAPLHFLGIQGCGILHVLTTFAVQLVEGPVYPLHFSGVRGCGGLMMWGFEDEGCASSLLKTIFPYSPLSPLPSLVIHNIHNTYIHTLYNVQFIPPMKAVSRRRWASTPTCSTRTWPSRSPTRPRRPLFDLRQLLLPLL